MAILPMRPTSSLFVALAISCGYFFFSFFEFAEFYLDEFMIFQGEINRAEQLLGHAFGADHHQRF